MAGETSVICLDPLQNLSTETGPHVRIIDEGFCGMTGSSGMRRGKYQISRKIAVRVVALGPRQMKNGPLDVADLSRYREQIRDIGEPIRDM
jgi:hypothetical protein